MNQKFTFLPLLLMLALTWLAPSVYAQQQQQEEDSSAVEAPIEDKWALIIGISKFKDSSINLMYPAKDAADFYNYLVNEAHFSPDHIELLTDQNATKDRILTELGDRWLPRVAHPNDLVVVFVSSHGSPSSMDAVGANYLIAHDTDKNRLYASGVPMQDLIAAVKERVHAKRVVLFLDACHSGAARATKDLTRVGNFDAGAMLQGTGQLVICSSQSNQVSWESERYPSGVFTAQLINALRSNGEKTKISDAFDVLKEGVESEVLTDRGEAQTPVLKMRWDGSALALATPAAKPRPAPADSLPVIAAKAVADDTVKSKDSSIAEMRPDLQLKLMLEDNKKTLAGMSKNLDEIVQSHVEWDVDWKSFNNAPAFQYVAYQGFDRVLIACRTIAIDSIGKEALKGAVKKVIVKNVPNFKQKHLSFSKGVVELDGAFGPDSSGYFKEDDIRRVIENGL